MVTAERLELPTGTVTLLLSDVEDSTRSWESDPVGTQDALEDLNGQVDELLARHRGIRPLEQGEGDSFVAAFKNAGDAVRCALAIQRALVGHRLRIRVGIHTGDALRRDEANYAGPTIIRTARIRNLAHGGQTLVSAVTGELIASVLPEGATLRDLGSHRLKGLQRPERIFQLCHPALRNDFPPLASIGSRFTNIPTERTTFVGRESEMAELASSLKAAQLVTVTGSGGCGKTRIALQVAMGVVDEFRDGVWLIDLTAISDSDGMGPQAARTLSVLHGPGVSPTEAVVDYLGDRQSLLVLDNCEHVCDAAAAFADAVLVGSPGTKVLATSRQPLGVTGELCWRLPSMSVPPTSTAQDGETLAGSEAEQLFVERATHACPGFLPNDAERRAIAEICRRVDGIPLALELAAARVKVLAPQQILAGLSERFRLLAGGPRTAVARQQTVEASLDWSHDLLTEAERRLFRRLGVFAATFDLEAAADVCGFGDIDPREMLDVLTMLIDKSLVSVNERQTAARYRLLETMRMYAQDRLEDAGEDGRVGDRHGDYYARLAEQAAPFLESRDRETWATRMEIDYPNLEAALGWYRTRGQVERLSRLVFALHRLWIIGYTSLRVPVTASIAWIDAALASEGALTTTERGTLMLHQCLLVYSSGDFARAITLGGEATSLARDHHDDFLLGRCLGALAVSLGFTRESLPIWEEALQCGRRSRDDYFVGQLLAAYALCNLFQDGAKARRCVEEAYELAATTANRATESGADSALAWILTLEGRPSEAIPLAERARHTAIDVGFLLGVVAAEGRLTEAYALAADWPQALAAADRLSDVGRRLGANRDAHGLQTRALFAAANGDIPRAVRLANEAVDRAHLLAIRAGALAVAAGVELDNGELSAAHAHIDELIQLSGDQGFIYASVQADILSARRHRFGGDNRHATERAAAGLERATGIGAIGTAIEAVEVLAGLAADRGSHSEAARLFGIAGAARKRTGYQRCHRERNVDIDSSRAGLGPDGFDASYRQGESMPLEAAHTPA